MTLVGRTTAIKTLTDAFTDCAEGCFRTVVVEGPTGCGKSALVHLLIERAATAGAVVLCATGFPAERRTAWSVVRRLLADRAPRIGDMPALCAELRALSEGRPLVLCVDDVHHADAESRAFVQYLARSARPARTLLVVAGTVHHEQGDPAFATELMRRPTSRRVRLERFGPAEVAALAERAGCSEHPAFLHESSGGNPLLLRALLAEHALADRRRPTASAPRTPDVDGPFAQAVRACLHRAGATAARVARAAALLDDAATPERIAELTGIAPPAVRQSLAGLHGAGLLSGTGFSHPAVRAAALGALPATDLVALLPRPGRLHASARPGSAPRVVDQRARRSSVAS
jgi:hypothetical protein